MEREKIVGEFSENTIKGYLADKIYDTRGLTRQQYIEKCQAAWSRVKYDPEYERKVIVDYQQDAEQSRVAGLSRAVHAGVVSFNPIEFEGIRNQPQLNHVSGRDGDYISLTDMLQAKDGEFFISDWLRNRNTIEFLGIWESVFNPGFNYGEFATIKSQAGLNSYKLSVKEWVEKTNAN